MGWQPQITFAEGIRQTVDWYIENKSWWQQILSGAYRS
jgi:dTDP-glucose 4,6-dehydratase